MISRLWSEQYIHTYMTDNTETNALLAPDEYDEITFMVHEYDVMWPNAERERVLADALEHVQNHLPKHISQDDAETIVDVVFDPLYEAATEDGFSLWVRFNPEEREAFEYPVYQRSPVGAWNSPNPSFGETGDQPTDSFFTAVVELFDGGDEGDDWGAVDETDWNDLTSPEKELIHSLRDAAIQGQISPYAAVLHDYAQWYTNDN